VLDILLRSLFGLDPLIVWLVGGLRCGSGSGQCSWQCGRRGAGSDGATRESYGGEIGRLRHLALG
jgi:hypothetical protein